MPEELPEGYYLENFEYLHRFVMDRYDHLLTADEKAYWCNFVSLPNDAKKLYVRLTNRKGPFFRVDKLNYKEIRDIPATLRCLESVSLLSKVIPAAEDAIGLCSKDELLNLELFINSPRKTRRSELVAQLEAQPDCNPVSELGIPVVEVLGLDSIMVFKLLFFGNFHQDMTEFVLHELVAPFESYDLSREVSVFSSREIIDQSVQLKYLSELSQEVVETDTTGELVMALVEELPARADDPMLARRYDRIVNRLGRHLERLGALEEALVVYQSARAAPARERQSRILDKLERSEEALAICEKIHQSPLDEAEWEFALSFGHRLAKKRTLETCLPMHERTPIGHRDVSLPKIADRVENCAVEYFGKSEGHCFYVENTLFRGLFGLAFWDVIFASVPGAFFHPFQRGPADLFTSDFVSSRQPQIERRLFEIADSARLRKIVMTCHEEKRGIANQFVNWTYLSEELIELALERIAPEHVRTIFDRLLVDLKNNTSGFPDLVLFTEDSYRLIEIKGPGDKIQKNQERWFRYFNTHQIPAEVVNVKYV